MAAWRQGLPYCNFGPHHVSRLPGGICLPGHATRLPQRNQRLGPSSLLRPRFSQTTGGGTGISTCCPSPTPIGLGLGPDLPWVDEPSPGNLRLSVERVLTVLFATHTGILTCMQSTCPYSHASTRMQRSSTESSRQTPTCHGSPLSCWQFGHNLYLISRGRLCPNSRSVHGAHGKHGPDVNPPAASALCLAPVIFGAASFDQ